MSHEPDALTPSTADENTRSLGFLSASRRLPAGNGAAWLGQGWRLFRRAPGRWLLAMVLSIIAYFMLSLVPELGGLLSLLFAPVLIAGAMAFAHAIDTHGNARVTQVFDGFRHGLGQLLLLGLLYLLMLIAAGTVTVLVGVLMVGVDGLGSLVVPGQALLGADLMTVIVLALVFSALIVPVMMAYWFAPMLVYFSGLNPLQALRASLRASLSNWLPLLIYGLVMLLFSIVILIIMAAITGFSAMGSLLSLVIIVPLLGLAVLVCYSVFLASFYLSFKDFFGDAANNHLE